MIRLGSGEVRSIQNYHHSIVQMDSDIDPLRILLEFLQIKVESLKKELFMEGLGFDENSVEHWQDLLAPLKAVKPKVYELLDPLDPAMVCTRL